MTIELRPVVPDDASRIFALHEATSPQDQARDRSSWEAQWRWTHAENPWIQPGVPVGIVAEEAGAWVVGHLGLTPVPLRKGRARFVGQASEGFLVDPA